jgi:DNA-directed RNA polymerase subunit H (RpoH/RPB5)
MKDNKCDKGNKSVAESLNAIVKPHLVTMSEQYNVYAKAILEMEEKIKSLKQIMLSQDFLNNIRDVNIVTCPSGAGMDKKKEMKKEMKKETKTKTETENIVLSNIEVETASTYATELSFFTPRQKDSLFWCFYIIVNNLAKYEYEKNYFTTEQEFKVKTIERIKKGENKQILKEHKMSKNMIESGLMGSGSGSGSGISPKILYALSLFYNVNIFYVYKNTYYEMFTDINAYTNTTSKIHIIKFNPETNYYSVCLSLDEGEGEGEGKTKILEYIKNSRKTCLELDNLDDVNKPLRTITTYSLLDLVNIAAKMNILDTHILDESPGNTKTNTKKKVKSKTKSELYTEIMESVCDCDCNFVILHLIIIIQ